MSRDVDRVIEYVLELERERFLPPVMAQVMVERLDPAPTRDEIERAATVVRGREDRAGDDADAVAGSMPGTVYGIRPHRPMTEAEDRMARAAASLLWPEAKR
jgi:hypothetical protein